MPAYSVLADPDLVVCARLHNRSLPSDALLEPEIDRMLAGGPQSFYERWLAVEVDGVVAGCAWSGKPFDVCVGVVVAEEFRGRGIGSLLADTVMSLAGVGDAWAFRVEPGDPAAQRLLDRHGFQRQNGTHDSRWASRPLAARDWSAVEPLELLTEAHFDDADQLEQIRKVMSIGNEDVPGAGPVTADEVRRHHEIHQSNGGFELIARDGAGNVTGAVTSYAAPWSPVLTSSHTLVDHDHRGRGLGRRLKEAQHKEAAKRGFERVVTDVRPDNAPMLAILRRLGYEQEDRPSYLRPATTSGR